MADQNTYYRCTLFWADANFGPSETYIIGTTTADLAANALNQLMAYRASMMFTSDQFLGVRISNTSGQRASKFVRTGGQQLFPNSATQVVVPPAGTLNKVSGGSQQTLVRNALLVSVGYNNNTRYTRRYISGIPRGIVGEDPQSLTMNNNSTFKTAFDNFAAFLQGGPIYLPAQDQTTAPQQLIASVKSSATTKLLGLLLPTLSDPSVMNVGVRVRVFNTRPAKGTRNPTINGLWTTAAGSDSDNPPYHTVYLSGSEDVTASSIRIMQTSSVQRQVKAFYGWGLTEAVAVVPHKRGASAIVPRGRRLNRASLDG